MISLLLLLLLSHVFFKTLEVPQGQKNSVGLGLGFDKISCENFKSF